MDKSIAIIGGSNLFHSSLVRERKEERFRTPFGPVTAYCDDRTMFIQRHGIHNLPPHLINHKANLSAIKQRGIRRIVAINSVGSLKTDIAPGTFCLVDDFISFYNIPTVDEKGRTHVTPTLCRELTGKIRALSDIEFKDVIYWQTTGPRFETPAEIRMMAQFADVVGMTLGSEVTIAAELELAYASVCMVDNYANGIAEEPLSFESFDRMVQQNQEKMDRFLKELVACLF